MKIFIVLSVLFAAAVVNAADEKAPDVNCYLDTVRGCKLSQNKQSSFNATINCNAQYGAITHLLPILQSYVNTHITRSFEYLLVATHFGNYEKNRNGFEKLFRELSDSTWADAFGLIKHIAKRGGAMNFAMHTEKTVFFSEDKTNYEMYELESLGKALDVQKKLAEQAFRIHEDASRRHDKTHDPEISQYLEEEFVEKHADTIRNLAGHVSDVSKLLSSGDASLAMYLFDEYLQKKI